jgi:hypothetical protein
VIKKELKRRAKHFENVLHCDNIIGKDTEKNENVCDNLEVKEDLLSEEELVTGLKK